MKTPISAASSLPQEAWRGRILSRYDSDYTWVALEFSDGTVAVLSVEEVVVGKWFEVFPLKIDAALPDFLLNYHFKWTALPAPFEICRASSLWREEWLEPVHEQGGLLGSGPHFVQRVAPLSGAPSDALAFEVEAGILLEGKDGRRIVIASSDNAPFKIDFETEVGGIEAVMQFHSMR